MEHKYDEIVEMLDENLEHFTKMLEIHREIVWQNEAHLNEWREQEKEG